jgi:hypothetical protein
MSRGLVIDTTTGVIKRQITAPAALLAQQVGTGESLYTITTDSGSFINDAVVVVSEEGDLAASESAPEGTTAPDLTIELVAT